MAIAGAKSGEAAGSGKRAARVQRALGRWFRVHQRDLPWRRTKDPYRILVSEIMLQQTQVDRVIPKYREFLRRFPNVRALARASPRDVLLAWAGMGYNRRALYLLRSARDVLRKFGGTVPLDPSKLKTLPGVGRYTAAAVATFAGKTPYALADTNVRRVIGRIFGGHPLPKRFRSDDGMLELVGQTMPRRTVDGLHPSLWGHLLMDFGAFVCRARPLCGECPVRSFCLAYPRIVSARQPAKKRSSVWDTKSGPSVPDRVLRGKILAVVRDHDPRSVSVGVLHPLFPDQSSVTLSRLLRGLMSDGLLAFTGARSVRLPRSLPAWNGKGS